ncbi:MAG: DUF192 domain-containing protein [Bacteroidetes bacterium]|nr:DUF192 domain-containing protein [Bacteroidota bacterium]
MKKKTIAVVIILVILVFLIFILFQPFQSPPEPVKRTGVQKPLSIEGSVQIFSSGQQTIPPIIVYIAIADDPYERSKGLMYRHSLPDTVGMFFIYERQEILNFWMKNTPISLDIIFLDRDYRVVSIAEHTHPFSEDMIPSIKPARFALEVNAGFAEKHGIKPGDHLVLSRYP